MCKFPMDNKRRKIWAEILNRDNWLPGPGAALCHMSNTYKLILNISVNDNIVSQKYFSVYIVNSYNIFIIIYIAFSIDSLR